MRIGILIFNRVEEMDFVGPLEVLASALEGRQGSVQLIAPSLDAVTCEKGMRVLPDVALADVEALDLLLVPGGSGARQELKHPESVAWLRKISPGCQWVSSVCTGSFLLVGAGVAEGRRVTTHHRFTRALAKMDKAEVLEGARFVVDGNLVSAAGVSSGIEMCLWLVEQMFGAAAEAEVKDYIAYDVPPRGGEILNG